MTLFKRSAIAMAILQFGGMCAAMAAEAESTSTTTAALPGVTVTGNWLDNPNEQKILDHAGARTIVERKQFRESGSSNVREVLRQIPGVQVQESNGTGGSEVSLNIAVRGLSARFSPRSTMLVDGVPLAFAPYGQPQLSLSPIALNNLDAIDVVRGAGSVRYGPQNVGGIINFVTRAVPRDFTIDGGLGAEFGSHGGKVKTTPSLFIGGTNDQGLGGALLYSGVHGQDFRSSNSQVDIDDLTLKGTYRISSTDDIAATLHHYQGLGSMPGGLTTAQYAADPFQSDRKFDEFFGRRTDASLKYTHKEGKNNFELLTYYLDTMRNSNVEQNGTGANVGKRTLTGAPRVYNVFAVEPRYSRLFAGDTVVQEVSVGYRFLKENSAEVATTTAFYNRGTDPFTLAPRISSTSRGGTIANAFYIDDRIDIGAWTITPGVRYEFIRSHNDFTDFDAGGVTTTPSITSRQALPTLSVLYRLNDNWSLFANAGRSFGPQQYSQLAQSTDNLHPEVATTYEMGTHFKGEALSGELTLFNIDFDKELQLTRPNGVDGIWTDLGATRHRGIESALRYDFSRWNPALKGLSISGTYTYTQAIQQAGAFAGRDLPFYSRQVASLGLRYERNRWTYNVDTFVQSQQHAPGTTATYVTQENAAGTLGDIPGWATVNVRAGYDFGKLFNNLKLAVGVKNLLDHRYFTRSSDNAGGKFVGQPQTLYMQASVSY